MRARKSAVLESWQREVRHDVPDLERLSRNVLVDPIDGVFDRVADWMEGSSDRAAMCTAGEVHVVQRFRDGVGIDSVVREYARLRQCVLVELNDFALVSQLDQAIDVAIVYATHRYLTLRDERGERFIGVLAHDLRTPLQCVMMASEMLLADERTARDRSLVEVVLDASDRMHRMVNDVLSWARLNLAEGFPIARRGEDFGTIVHSVVDEARILHGEHAVTFEILGNVRGQFDRDRVHQAITNLVKNAIEHGSGTAHLKLAEVDDGQTIVLVVRNTGGLRAPTSTDVTDPFRRKQKPTTARGLGLYIVDQIARAHGATVDMTYTGGDATITIRWPTCRPPIPIEQAATL